MQQISKVGPLAAIFHSRLFLGIGAGVVAVGAIIAISVSLTLPVPSGSSPAVSESCSYAGYRLPNAAVPISQAISLTPEFNAPFRFTGSTEIVFNVTQDGWDVGQRVQNMPRPLSTYLIAIHPCPQPRMSPASRQGTHVDVRRDRPRIPHSCGHPKLEVHGGESVCRLNSLRAPSLRNAGLTRRTTVLCSRCLRLSVPARSHRCT